MARILKDNVAVEGRWYSRGQSDVEVGDAASQIGDHAWEEVGSGASAAPAPPSPSRVDVVKDASQDDEGGEPAEPVDADNAPAVEPAEQPAKNGDAPKPPPQSGPGSSEAKWRRYAEQMGVDVSEAKDRAGVIAAVESAGKSVE